MLLRCGTCIHSFFSVTVFFYKITCMVHAQEAFVAQVDRLLQALAAEKEKSAALEAEVCRL